MNDLMRPAPIPAVVTTVLVIAVSSETVSIAMILMNAPAKIPADSMNNALTLKVHFLVNVLLVLLVMQSNQVALILMNATQMKHALKIRFVKIPLAHTHVTASTVSRKLATAVSTSMNALLQFVTNTQLVQILWVHLHVHVLMAMKEMASFARILTSVPLIYARKNLSVSITKVHSHVNARQDTLWMVTHMSMLMSALM